MRLLAMDAALGPCSMALLENGECLAEQHRDSRAGLGDMPAMAQALVGSEPLDAVAVTVGPGSFTGLRSAIALAQGVALGRGVPLVGVTVAEAFAQAVCLPPGTDLWVALDTRRGRIFLARGARLEALDMDRLPHPDRPVMLAGDAAELVLRRLEAMGCRAAIGPEALSAACVGRVALERLAGRLTPCPARPLYVEPPAARVAAGLRPAPI